MPFSDYEKAWEMINSPDEPQQDEVGKPQDAEIDAGGDGKTDGNQTNNTVEAGSAEKPVQDNSKVSAKDKNQAEGEEDDDAPQHSAVMKIMDIVEMKTETGVSITTKARRLRKTKTNKAKFDDYSCILRKQVDQTGFTLSINLEVKSPFLRNLFKELLSDFKHLNLEGDIIMIPKPYEPLYYRQDEIRARQATMTAGPARRELSLVIEFLDLHIEQTRKECERHVAHGKITSELAWTLFPPNEIILIDARGSAPSQCAKVHGCSRAGNSLIIRYSMVSWNGRRFGNVRRQIVLPLPMNAGSFPISDLIVYPLKFHLRKDEVRQNMTERGRKYYRIVQRAHMTYNGVIWVQDPIDQELIQVHVNGRVMIDYAEYVRNSPQSAVTLEGDFGVDISEEFFPCSCGSRSCKVEQRERDKEEEQQENAKTKEQDEVKELDDEEALVCPAFVQGFTLREKLWAEFRVDHLKEVEWSAEAYQRLEMDDSTKQIIHALVKSHRKHSAENPPDFDDIIAGKGLGLVFLLQGPPGLGKTLTAGM